MKLNTLRKYNFLASYKGYTLFEDPNTGAKQRTYENPISIKCWVVNNALGQLSLHTKSRLQNDGLISFLRNKKWEKKLQFIELVYPIGTPNGAVWRVIEGMPMLDSFGNVYEYKYRCQMIVPALGSVTEDSPSELTESNWTVD